MALMSALRAVEMGMIFVLLISAASGTLVRLGSDGSDGLYPFPVEVLHPSPPTFWRVD